MISRTTIRIPVAAEDGSRPFFGRNQKVEIEEVRKDISQLIEGIAGGALSSGQHAFLRSCIYGHYHPELKIGPRVQIYQSVKEALEDGNLNQLRDIAGIRKKSAYINTISNVGKRSSYFGGLIGVTVAGYFLLPPVIKLGVLPVAKRTMRRFAPRSHYLIPIDKSLKISKLVGKSPRTIYQGIRYALGGGVRQAGKPVSAKIDTTPMDDLIGNLFFRALIDQSSFEASAKEQFRNRSQIAFLYDAARVSRQLEGLARDPGLAWERIFHYTNFAMFLKSMESSEVPVKKMLQQAVETISRASIGKSRKDIRFYTEFERGLKNLNYTLQVVEPLDTFNERDAFDDIESRAARLAFFEQNRLVMERLYIGHDMELKQVRPMFSEFEAAASMEPPKKMKTREERYAFFQSRVKSIIASYRNAFKCLGKAELESYDYDLFRMRN